MSNNNNNQLNIPQAREAMDHFKMQAAQEVGINLANSFNGHLPSRDAGSVEWRMVKIMVDTCDWLVYYVHHGSSNSRHLLEYAQRRADNCLIQIKNIYESEDDNR